MAKNLPDNAGDAREAIIPSLTGKIPGGGNDNLLQYLHGKFIAESLAGTLQGATKTQT